MNWKIGQKLVCVWGFKFEDSPEVVGCPTLPKKGDIVTYDGEGRDVGFLYLAEHNNADPRQQFDSVCFRPLLGDSAKEKLLNSFVEISEKSDFPIPQKETA